MVFQFIGKIVSSVNDTQESWSGLGPHPAGCSRNAEGKAISAALKVDKNKSGHVGRRIALMLTY